MTRPTPPRYGPRRSDPGADPHQPHGSRAGHRGNRPPALGELQPFMTPDPRRPDPGHNRSRPWPWVRWWFSAVWIIPMAMAGYLVVDAMSAPDTRVRYQVAAGDQPAAGVRVTAGQIVATTDPRGDVTLDSARIGTAPVLFEQDGYHAIQATLPAAGGEATTLQLQSSTVTGLILDSATGIGLPGVLVSISGSEVSTLTGAEGRYRLDDVPADATLAFRLDGYGITEDGVSGRTAVDAMLTWSRVAGAVRGPAGEPVANARVVAGGRSWDYPERRDVFNRRGDRRDRSIGVGFGVPGRDGRRRRWSGGTCPAGTDADPGRLHQSVRPDE